MTGRVVVVGTPIGNLADLAPRAAAALASADVVACEDTRRTGRLLAHLELRAPELVRLDEHTEGDLAGRLVGRAAAGEVVAEVSDAGMPGLSDPGGRVVATAAASGVVVEVVPGPFAGAVAAVASALLDPSGRFVFEGFLPRKGEARAARLAEVAGERRAVVLYEAPHRVARTLEDLVAAAGPDRPVALCRELTKLHEEVWRGTLGEAVAYVEARPPRGEYVVVLGPAPPDGGPSDDEVRAALDRERSRGATGRDAAARVAAELGVAPNRVKRLLHPPGPPT
ncbi:MAG: 16S rRNA (cytidine(1402)-2'-O)-methyltransferase [Acidobacteria bacterium]|nr:16S rRNA (cytidine(1402)-2'-O)-methyltransferase [Acidobacteriota bacterium]